MLNLCSCMSAWSEVSPSVTLLLLCRLLSRTLLLHPLEVTWTNINRYQTAISSEAAADVASQSRARPGALSLLLELLV